MAVFPISGPATRQPQAAPRINWDCPAAKGLQRVWIPTTGYNDLVRGAPVTLSSTIPARLAGRGGLGWTGTGQSLTGAGGATQYIRTGFAENPSALTLFVVFESFDFPNTGSAFGYPLGREQYSFNFHHSNAIYRGAFTVNAGGTFPFVSIPGLVPETLYCLVGTWDGSNIRVWKNNEYIGSAAATGALPSTPTDPLTILANATLSTAGAFNGRVYLAGVGTTAIPEGAAASLARNPWQIFEGPEAAFFFTGAGGASYSLTAEQGSYTLTGQAATLRASRRLTAAQGTYSHSGQAAVLRASRKLAAAQGSYAHTGQAANLRADRRLSAAQGSYSHTGQAAALRRSFTLVAGQGSYTITGQDAALRASRVLVAGQGVYTHSGQAVAFQYTPAGRVLVAEQGTYTLSGQAATLRASRVLTAAQGAYVLTGVDVALRRLRTLSAEQGTYSVTGNPAGFLWQHVLTADSGLYTYTGNPAGLTYTTVEAPVDSDAIADLQAQIDQLREQIKRGGGRPEWAGDPRAAKRRAIEEQNAKVMAFVGGLLAGSTTRRH